jgi:hypothetical protein
MRIPGRVTGHDFSLLAHDLPDRPESRYDGADVLPERFDISIIACSESVSSETQDAYAAGCIRQILKLLFLSFLLF